MVLFAACKICFFFPPPSLISAPSGPMRCRNDGIGWKKTRSGLWAENAANHSHVTADRRFNTVLKSQVVSTPQCHVGAAEDAEQRTDQLGAQEYCTPSGNYMIGTIMHNSV